MAAENVEVREGQPGKGRGVFALRRFTIGEMVLEITGQVIVDANYDSRYCMELGLDTVLEPHAPGGLINHSCDPNCELTHYSDTTLALYALVNIEPGRELTFDYQWPAEVGAVRCRCKSPKCRAYIVEAGAELRKLRRLLKRRAPRKKAR
jgi:SET domain-containing protein